MVRPKNCEVCEEAQSKYKCPTCRIPYYIPCAKPEPFKEEKSYADPPTNDGKPCYVDEPSEVLQESHLQSIASSNEIRNSLKDEKLQKLIYNIESSADPDDEFDKAMEDESFRLFTEKILSTICP
ncbi:hypothetical protein OROGR_019539 [Orobanche gracilis]